MRCVFSNNDFHIEIICCGPLKMFIIIFIEVEASNPRLNEFLKSGLNLFGSIKNLKGVEGMLNRLRRRPKRCLFTGFMEIYVKKCILKELIK